MNFSEWQTMLFSATGRIRRSQWWLWNLCAAIALAIVETIANIATNGTQVMMNTGHLPMLLMIVYLICGVIGVWIGVCTTAKRWHDRSKSGWLAIISFIPLVNLWTLVECGFLDGTPGPNTYGPDPKGRG